MRREEKRQEDSSDLERGDFAVRSYYLDTFPDEGMPYETKSILWHVCSKITGIAKVDRDGDVVRSNLITSVTLAIGECT